MSTMTETTQVYRVYIKAPPQAVWDAITKPEWTERYGYGGVADYDLRPGGRALARKGAVDGRVPGRARTILIDGEVRRGRPAEPARPDLAHGDGPGDEAGGLHAR